MADDSDAGGQLLDQVEQRFATNLRSAREHAGLSQDAVAARMRDEGYAAFRQQTITRIESGERAVKLGEAMALARITRTSLDALARPAGLAKEAWLILDALRTALDARDQVSDLHMRQTNALAELDRLVRKARNGGYASELRQEIAAADHALAASRPDAESLANQTPDVPARKKAAG